jgi:hypothetical protein
MGWRVKKGEDILSLATETRSLNMQVRSNIDADIERYEQDMDMARHADIDRKVDNVVKLACKSD